MSRAPWVRRPPEWGVDPVPPETRKLRTFDIFVLWTSLGVGLLVLVAGSLLVLLFGLSLLEAVAVAVAGSLIGSLLLALAARTGATHGVPTMVSLRPVLGLRGSYVPTALNVLQNVGWAAFELYIMGVAAVTLSGAFLGSATVPVWVLVFGGWCTLLALGGPLAVVRRWLRRGAIWLVWASIAVIAYQVLTHPLDLTTRVCGPGGAAFCFATGPPQPLLALDIVIAMPISWWPLIADYNRFARGPSDSFRGTVLGYTVANTLFYALGAALVVLTLQGNAIAAIGALGFGAWALLFILADETDNAFANLYSTAVSLQNAFPRARQWLFVLLAAITAAVVALLLHASVEPLGGPYESFLLLIGGAFVPLLGVMIADGLAVRRGRQPIAQFFGDAPSARIGALAAWGIGALLYYGIVWNLIPNFPPVGATLPSFLAAMGLHVAFARVEAAFSVRKSAAGGG